MILAKKRHCSIVAIIYEAPSISGLLVAIFGILGLPFGVHSIWQWRKGNFMWSSYLTWDGREIGKNDVLLTSESHNYGGCLFGEFEFAHHLGSLHNAYEACSIWIWRLPIWRLCYSCSNRGNKQDIAFSILVLLNATSFLDVLSSRRSSSV